MPRSNTLRCQRCKSTNILVSESQQFKMASVYDPETQRSDKKAKMLHADVRCQNCRHRWWSRHDWALAESRRKDETAKAQVQQEREG